MKRICFYIVSWTGGFLMSFIGLIVIGICACFGQVKKYHGRLYGVVGSGGGGLSLGCFFVCCKESIEDDFVCGHESGHGLQNCLGGPLFPFVIWLPSTVRYGYRELKYGRRGQKPSTDYYSIGFERQASDGGKKYIITDLI